MLCNIVVIPILEIPQLFSICQRSLCYYYTPLFRGIYPICGLAQNGLCNLKVLAGELVFGTVDIPLLAIAVVCKERTSVASIISRHKSMPCSCLSPVSDCRRKCRIRVSISNLLDWSHRAVGRIHRGQGLRCTGV